MRERLSWELNASTGNHIARVRDNVRLVRMGASAPYLYNAENWGDYSLAFPVRSGWYSTPRAALAALEELRECGS